jgi:hypothetical protein
VVKMATVIEECPTETQRDIAFFFFFGGQKNFVRKIDIKKCAQFTVRSVCRVKRFTTGSKIFVKDVRKSQTRSPCSDCDGRNRAAGGRVLSPHLHEPYTSLSAVMGSRGMKEHRGCPRGVDAANYVCSTNTGRQ